MAKGKKTGGRNFVKGQSGNLNGQPKIPKEVKEIRRLTTADYVLTVNKFLYADISEIKSYMNNPKATALELMVAKVVVKSIESGDQTRLQFLLDRLIGPVKQKVEHTGENGSAISLQHQSSEQIEREVDELRNEFNSIKEVQARAAIPIAIELFNEPDIDGSKD